MGAYRQHSAICEATARNASDMSSRPGELSGGLLSGSKHSRPSVIPKDSRAFIPVSQRHSVLNFARAPPSTSSVWPVIKDERRLSARNRMASATS